MEEKSTFPRIHSPKISTVLTMVIAIIFLTWYLNFLWKRRYLYKYSSRVPGPFSLPLIGTAYAAIGNNADVFKKLEDAFKEYPKIFRFWLGTDLYFGISDPQFTEILLTRCLEKTRFYRIFENLLGHGLITAPVNTWKKHRKHVMATFKQKILDGYVEVFVEKANIMFQKLEKFDGKGEFDLFHYISNFSLESVCESAMGTRVNLQESDSFLPKYIETVTAISFKRTVSLWYHFDIIFHRTKLFRISDENANKILNFTDTVTREKLKNHENEKQHKLKYGDEYRDKEYIRKVFLDHIIDIADQEQGTFTPEEIRDEVTTLIIAAFDTTAASSCYTLTLLGMFPEIQNKVLEEVLEVLGPDRDPEDSDLPQLKYTEMVMKESLRLFPVAPLFGRIVQEDIDVGEYIIPKGSSLLFSVMAIHYNEKIWPNPYRFIPERFLPEEASKRSPCAYLPFSHGPRNCLGQRYAMMLVKTVIAMMVRKFEISSTYRSIEEIKLEGDIVTKPVQGYKVSIEIR